MSEPTKTTPEKEQTDIEIALATSFISNPPKERMDPIYGRGTVQERLERALTLEELSLTFSPRPIDVYDAYLKAELQNHPTLTVKEVAQLDQYIACDLHRSGYSYQDILSIMNESVMYDDGSFRQAACASLPEDADAKAQYDEFLTDCGFMTACRVTTYINPIVTLPEYIVSPDIEHMTDIHQEGIPDKKAVYYAALKTVLEREPGLTLKKADRKVAKILLGTFGKEYVYDAIRYNSLQFQSKDAWAQHELDQSHRHPETDVFYNSATRIYAELRKSVNDILDGSMQEEIPAHKPLLRDASIQQQEPESIRENLYAQWFKQIAKYNALNTASIDPAEQNTYIYGVVVDMADHKEDFIYEKILHELKKFRDNEFKGSAGLAYWGDAMETITNSLEKVETTQTCCKILKTWAKGFQHMVKNYALEGVQSIRNIPIEQMMEDVKRYENVAKLKETEWKHLFSMVDKVQEFTDILFAESFHAQDKRPLLQYINVQEAKPFDEIRKNRHATPQEIYYAAIRENVLKEPMLRFYDADILAVKTLKDAGYKGEKLTAILAESPRFDAMGKPELRRKDAARFLKVAEYREKQKNTR